MGPCDSLLWEQKVRVRNYIGRLHLKKNGTSQHFLQNLKDKCPLKKGNQ
jgi:hypothetical protein